MARWLEKHLINKGFMNMHVPGISFNHTTFFTGPILWIFWPQWGIPFCIDLAGDGLRFHSLFCFHVKMEKKFVLKEMYADL